MPGDESTTICSQARVYVKADLTGQVTDQELTAIPEADQPVVKPFAKGLATCYLVDTGSEFRYVLQRHLREAGWTRDALHTRSVDNLAAFTRGKTKLRDYGGFYAVFVDGNFEASLLAVEPFWDGVARNLKVGPEIVAAIPARDILAFCKADSPEGLTRLRDTVARVYPTGDHPITNRLYRRKGREWVPFDE